jgi:hypothetical protein
LPTSDENSLATHWRLCMFSVRITAVLALGTLFAAASVANAQARGISPTVPKGTKIADGTSQGLPLKYTGKPTIAEISAADLMTRLYIFADDSMGGREVGTEYNNKGTAYIEREVRRMGLVPGGDNGGYFQNLPVFTTSTDPTSSLKVGDKPLVLGADFIPAAMAEQRVSFDGSPVVYGGLVNDSTTWLSADDMAGKVVVLGVAPTSMRGASFAKDSRFGRATAVFINILDRIPQNFRSRMLTSTAIQRDESMQSGPPASYLSSNGMSLLFSATDSLRAGAAGKPITGTLILHKAQAPGRNVIAILPGSDPKLKGEYVAIGAHNDHIGFRPGPPVDHDSVRAFNMIARPQGADSPPAGALTAEQIARIRTMTDSLHALHGARLDSINNGADDDGTGTVSVLEIAEAYAASKTSPKRSIIFVWHAGEEKGMWGSEYFTDHPTVPRDSIVAQLNMDMVGRGATADITGESKEGGLLHGGPGYLQLIGSRRLSTELGDLMESVNTKGKYGFNFDYGMDANGHPQNIYCRSDHYEYARYGIPIVFMTTGGHSDYHQVTDEPQYIDYAHMAEIATFVKDAATTIANLDHRVVVDKPKPDPKGRCVQ